MEHLETIIQVVFVVIFLFGRVIAKLLVSGPKGNKDKPLAGLPDSTETKSSASPPQKPARLPVPKPEVKAIRTPGIRRLKKPDAAPSLKQMAATILTAMELQQARAATLANTCSYRRFSILETQLKNYAEQLRSLIKQMEAARDSKTLQRSMLDSYNNTLMVINDRLSAFDAVISERSNSYSAHFNAADQVLADLSALCSKRHHGYETQYQYMFPGVVVEASNIKGGLYGVSLTQEEVTQPRRWPGIAFAMHHAIARRGKFATKIATDLSLPQAISSMSYFVATGRLMSAGLVSAWMDWIYADVAAALQLGEAYAYCLLEQCERTGDAPELSRFSINERGHVLTMPWICRLISVHAAMVRMGLFDMDAFTSRLNQLIERNPNLVVSIAGRGEAPLPAASVNSDLFQIAATLVDTPLSVLGGYSVKDVTGTDFGVEASDHLQNLAESLTHGKPKYRASASHVVIAIHMALKKARNAESRIVSAALKSLQKHKEKQPIQCAHPIGGQYKSPTRLADVFSPAFLPQTVMIGALSKNRGGISHNAHHRS